MSTGFEKPLSNAFYVSESDFSNDHDRNYVPCVSLDLIIGTYAADISTAT